MEPNKLSIFFHTYIINLIS